MFERIMVPTNGSALSEKAVASALDLAAQHHASLVMLRVVARQPINYFDGVSASGPEEIARLEAVSVKAAQTALDTLLPRARARGVDVETTTMVADGVAETIIGAARKYHSDLIVMASHGRKGLAQLFLGSETQHVLTHSKLPVLVVR